MLVLLMLAGLPVAGVVCGVECVTPSEVSDHCHTDASSDAAAFSARVADGCDGPLLFNDVLTRERVTGAATSIPSASTLLAHASATHGFTVDHVLVWHTRPPSSCPGLSAGTHLPLRI